MNKYIVHFDKLDKLDEQCAHLPKNTFRQSFNQFFNFPDDASHSLDEIASLTGVDKRILQQVFDRGVGAWTTNPTSVRSKQGVKKNEGFAVRNRMTKEQWGYARVYGFVMSNNKQVGANKPDDDLYRQLYL